MTMPSHPAQDHQLAIVKAELMIPLTEIKGDVRLVLQRLDSVDKRVDDQATEIKRMDARLDAVERDQVTRMQLDERSKKTITILALISTVVTFLVGTGITIIISVTS
jgi:uncharacterized protein YlxW (UPF0749 family)